MYLNSVMLVLLFHYYLRLYLLGILWQFITSNIILTTQYEQKLKWSQKCLFFVCLAFIHIIMVTQWFPLVIFTFMYRNPPPNSFKAIEHYFVYLIPYNNLSWFFSHQDSLMSFKILSWFDSVFFSIQHTSTEFLCGRGFVLILLWKTVFSC